MKKTAFIISLFALLLMLPPLILIVIGWNWSPETQISSLKWLLWLTNTAGAPYSIITVVFFSALTAYAFRQYHWLWLKIVTVLIICILTQQGLKSLLKSHFQEARPYVVWLEQQHNIPSNDFYDLKRSERAKLVKGTVKSAHEIPNWQRKHWQAETGYSFPSGHMLFAAGWALLLIGLFWMREQYLLSILLAIWAEGIAFSRMLLGMHWPIDIIVSTMISACFAIIGCKIINRFLLTKISQ